MTMVTRQAKGGFDNGAKSALRTLRILPKYNFQHEFWQAYACQNIDYLTLFRHPWRFSTAGGDG